MATYAIPGAPVGEPADDTTSNRDEAVRGLLQGNAWQFSGTRLLTYSLHSDSALADWSAAQIVAVDQAFAAWAAVANVRFERVPGPIDYELSQADLAITISEDLAYVFPGAAALGVVPDPAYATTLLTSLGLSRADYPRPEGDIFFNAFSWELLYVNQGAVGFSVALHEIGHALGLKHPHDDGGNGRPTFADDLGIGDLDNGQQTLMSYNDAFPMSPWYDKSYQVTPMVLDILAIQHIYGANMTYRTGNDTYRLLNDYKVRAIWDAGGIDTFDASQLAAPVVIELAEGIMIEHGQYSRTAIAYHVTIENATGSAYGDSLTGNTANNRLDGRGGADVLTGGAGDDTYVVDRTDDMIVESAGQGTDSVESFVTWVLADPLEHLKLLGSAAINATGNGGANVLTGNAAANVLDGGAGADTLAGGVGNDIYWVDDVGDAVSELSALATEIDSVFSSVGFALGANLENLTLLGSGAIDGTGNALANRIVGNAADNILSGGLGNDTYVVQNAGDSIVEAAGAGIDAVQSSVSWVLGDNLENLTLTGADAIDGGGNALANVIFGNDAGNVLSGGPGNDVLTGNGGADRLDGGAGGDRMTGGAGGDTYVVDSVLDVVSETGVGGADAVESSITFVLGATLENLTLTGAGNINGTGNALGNTIVGNDANNILNGGLGADVLSGGAGDDTYVVDNAGDAVMELAGEGTDAVHSLVSWVLGAEVENLVLLGSAALNGTGNGGANVLTGNAGVNVLTGDDGDDTYVVQNAADVVVEAAGEGTDAVHSLVSWVLGAEVENLVLLGSAALNGTGNGGANVLTGNAAANVLDGGAGADTLNGGAGSDLLTGGADADLFVFNTTLNAASNVDRISDFVAAIDRFMLDDAIFAGLAPGALTAEAFAAGAGMTAATTASQRIIYNLTTGMLFWDADGKPAAGANLAPVAFAQLTSAVKPALNATDFQIFSA